MAGASDFVQTPQAVRLACPNCDAPVSLRTPGHTTVVTCESCRSLLDATVPGLEILQRADKTTKGWREPAFKLGTRGKLEGLEWEVTGYLIRTERKYKVYWREYLLFNPLAGFRWLVENDGHWTLVGPYTDPLFINDGPPRVPGRNFRVYHHGMAEVAHVMGEFYWRVKVGNSAKTGDYVDPPYLLSTERNGEEINASLGHYLQPSEVRRAFPDAQLPSRNGVGPHQPLPTDGIVGPLFGAAAIFTLVLIVLTAVSGGQQRQLVRHTQTSTFRDTSAVELVLGEFTLSPADGNLDILTEAEVSNSYASITYTLFNETTGESFYLSQDLEYYSGVDGGESWSEGSRDDSKFLTGLPPGDYTLTAEMETDPKDPLRYFTQVKVDVQANVRVWSNFWLATIAMWGIAMLVGFVHAGSDAARWTNSDYSPYASES